MLLDLQLDYSCQCGQFYKSHSFVSDSASPSYGLLFVVFRSEFLRGFVCCFLKYGSECILMSSDSGLKYPSLLLAEFPLYGLSWWASWDGDSNTGGNSTVIKLHGT